MMFNYKELKLSLIAFILLFLIIDVTNSLTEVSYHETESNLQVLEGDSFSDNSLILRLVRPSQLDNCYEPKLYLRLVKSDGTVQPLDLGDDIPQNNFCKIDPLTGTSFHKHKHNNHCRKRWDNCDDDNNNNDNNNDNKNNNNDDNNSGGGKGSPKGGNNGDNNGSPNEGNNNGDNGGPNGGPNGGDNNGGNGGPNGGPNGGDNTGSNGGNGGPNGGDNGGNGGTPGTPGGAPGTPGGAPGGAPGTPGGAPGGAPGTPGGAPGGAPGTPGGAPGGAPGTPGGAPGGAPGGTPGAPGGTPGAPGGTPGAPGGTPGAPGGTPGAPGGTPGAPGGTPGAPGGVPGTTPVPLPAIPPTNSLFDNIHVYAISKEYILLTYYCNIPTSNELCGKIIDFSGATKNMTVFNNFNGLCTNPKIIKSNYDDGGILYTCYKQDTASIRWVSYSAPSIIDGTIKEKYSGEVGNITRYDLTYIFSTEDRGYAIVNGFLSNTQSTLSQWVVLANFITNDGQTKGTFVIFSQSTETSAVKSIPRCNIAYQLYGYSCILYIESTEKTFINIDFTSKGAVLNSQMFNVSQLNNNNQLYDVRNLYKGGECFVITELDQNVRGYVYSNDGIYNNTWKLPETYTYTSKIFGIFPDNTVWAIATGSSIAANQWVTVYSTALTTYSTVQGDTGYGSYSILSTVPERNAVIKPGLNQITIAYVMSNIEPSTGYITISQKNSNGIGNDFVRTKIPARSSPSGTTNNANNVTINGSVVTVMLEDYIFDRGNATYVIKIDDDFVEVNGQNLIGGSWQVLTEPGSGKNEPGGTRASILLTPGGTKNYLEIKKKDDVKTYVNGLSDEISRALAIEKGRIFIPYERYQYNRNTREDQILLRVDVKDTNIPDQPSSNALRNSLDKAVLSKGTSSIPIGPYTENLDSAYGSPESPHLWKRYRFILIGVIIGLFLLILFALLARKKFQGGRNFFTIVMFPLILVDFVLDIIVLAVHGRDLKWFFICGWVFFLVPILFNIIISWFLIDYQLNHSKPTEHWWKENPRTALGFTLLSCIDLEALNVVSSRCAGYNALNARFTEKGRKRVLISILFITFIEDVPQLIIYALYQRYIVITEIIPILVLSSSCIILLFKIISFIYLMFIYKPHRALTSTVDKVDDTNSDTASVESGGGGAPTSETTARRQTGVTELGNIGRSSETRIDDDNNDNEIKAEKAGLTKGGFLAGDIFGEKSQTSKRTTEEKIVEDSSEEETFEEKEIKYTEEHEEKEIKYTEEQQETVKQQETEEQEETTTTTTTYYTEDVSGDNTEINPNTGISSQSEVTKTVTTVDGDTTTTVTETFYE